MRFWVILACVKGWLNQGWKHALLSTFSELSFESGFRYPFQRLELTPIFMRFGAIFTLVQGWSKQGWKYTLLSTFGQIKVKNIWEISIDTYLFELWIYYGPRLMLVKPRFRIWTFVDLLGIEFWKRISVPIWDISMDTYLYEI